MLGRLEFQGCQQMELQAMCLEVSTRGERGWEADVKGREVRQNWH